MRKIFIIALNTFLLLLIINFLIVFFPQKLINEKYIGKNLINYFGFLYHVYYNETYNRNISEIGNYTVFLGDSYAWGAGEPRKIDGVAHYFKKNNPKMNFLQVGYPGGSYDFQEKILHKIVKKLKKEPEKLFLFLYEGNDFYDEISFKSKSESQLFFKNLKLNTYNYLPVFAKPLELLYGKIRSINSKQNNSNLLGDWSTPGRLIKNEIYINEEKFTIKNYLQNACSLRDEKQKNLFKESIINYINVLDKKYPKSEKIFVYIPSPASLYIHEKIYSRNYLNKTIENYDFKETQNCHENLIKFVANILEELSLENLSFFNSTIELKKITKNKFIHGLSDVNHFNPNGYKIFAELLEKI
tara:strand:- start:207 stop:1277 length:1071 start_codon:yes stop_codon:yes gene_type:complete